MRQSAGYKRQRCGKVLSLALIAATPVLLMLMLLPVNAALLHEARTTQLSAGDAAALAGVQVLVDDRLLIGSPPGIRELLDEALAEARRYVKLNRLVGQEIEVKVNPNNDPQGDAVFGSWTGQDAELVIDKFDNPNFLRAVNAVKVMLRRTRERRNAVSLLGGSLFNVTTADLITESTAVYDRRLRGFRPQAHIPVPLAPIALLSDCSGVTENTWEDQVERHGGRDAWRWDRRHQRFEHGADGLYEMAVRLGGGLGDSDDHPGGGRGHGDGDERHDGRHNDGPGNGKGDGRGRHNLPNAVVLQLGTAGMDDVCRQLLTGVTRADVERLGTELILNPADELVVPGRLFFHDTGRLRSCLERLQLTGEARIWPLLKGVHPESGMPIVCGFVAARVVSVHSGNQGRGNGGRLRFVLQPTMISTTTAVTVPAQHVNRYVGRVHLVQ